MKKRNHFSRLQIFIISPLLLIFGISLILAQESPGGMDFPLETQGPSAQEIAQFEQEFGAPPTDFEEPAIEKPKFEQPNKVPEEVKKYATDKELVEIYCAMVHWKSGSFFSALDAVKKYVVPAVEKAKELGVEVEVPDTEALRAEGERKIEAICQSPSLDVAENLVQEFSSWGQNEVETKFDNLKETIQTQIKTKGDELRKKVETEIEQFVAVEKEKLENELKQEAEELVAAKQTELEEASEPPDVEAVKAELEAVIRTKVEARKAELERKIEEKVDELVGEDKKRFEEIGAAFENIGSKINEDIKAGEINYLQYKEQTFVLRKNLILRILDKNIEEGLKQLEAASSDIETARKEDPSIKSVEEITSEIKRDRNILAEQLDAVLESGDEVAFQEALNGFKLKWEGYRNEMEKSASQAVSKACTVALAQFDNAKKQIDPGLTKIQDLQSKCVASISDECLKINEFSERFGVLTAKLTDIKTEMEIAGKMCQIPETADRQNLIALLKKIQTDAEDVKVYGNALEAEKTKVIADSIQKVCSQALPQLDAAKSEIKRNDFVILENNINRCKGKTSEQCNVVNQLSGEFNQLKSKIDNFLANVEEAENLCNAAKDEEDLAKMRDILNILKNSGDKLRLAAKELQAEQAEKASEKALCRAIIGKLDIAKGEISSKLKEINSLQSSCNGKSDEKCKRVNSLSSGFSNVKTQTENFFKKIESIKTTCDKAGVNSPSEDFLNILDSLKADEENIEKVVANLMDQVYKIGVGIWIEAESAKSFNVRTGVSNPMAREKNPNWRPPYFGDGTWYMGAGGDYLFYEFEVPVSGKYQVWVRDYVDKFQARGIRRIIIEFDGKRYGVFPEVNIPAPGDKGVLGWHKIGEGKELGAGKHTMKITKESSTRGAAILDVFYLTTGSEDPPEK